MTREEAIKWLKDMKDTIELYNSLSNSYTFDKFPQAIDMAISALSAEENRPIKVRDDGTLFVKVLDVSKVERVIIGDDSMAIREDFPKPFSNFITESPNEVVEKDDEVIEKQVTSKLKNPCDSLLTEESADSKEQKSKLDLISRAEAVDKLREERKWTEENAIPYEDSDVGVMVGLDRAIRILQGVPSVSAERVIRCKDCEYKDKPTCPEVDNIWFTDNDFCSWAKMKGGTNG